jgi:hypothetical protein
MPRWPVGNVTSPEAQRVSQFLREVSQEWQEAVELDAATSPEWDELAMVTALENVSFAPPVLTMPLRVRVQGIKAGQPHSATMDDFDSELMESLDGNL